MNNLEDGDDAASGTDLATRAEAIVGAANGPRPRARWAVMAFGRH
jgi:hypothetical protein